MTEAAIRPAATLILWRAGRAEGAEVLMGQRGAGAVFMPSKFVLPGGRVDAEEAPRPGHLAADCAQRLALEPLAETPAPDRLAGAALRELREETGLAFRDGGPLRFIFRAITPRGSPRRFDARFFLGPAEAILGDPDDFRGAEDELSALQWVPLSRARAFDLPFITEIVLAEVAHLLAGGTQPGVPFFDNRDAVSRFRRLGA